MDVRNSRSPLGCAAVLIGVAGLAYACGPDRFRGASSCAPPALEFHVGFSTRQTGGCAGVYGYLGLVKLKTGRVLTAEVPGSRPAGPLPESSAPAVVSVVSRSSNGHTEKLKAVAEGAADLIVRTPICHEEDFVTTPSPRFVGSKAVSGPCRVLRIEVTGG
ncbi:hypothetical protein [Actinoallomurus iriomotensis]|uniref:Lipoprotein n=1 Tax=Actinoallomurus iriomotensis TaxID=478107 RepID=A0A9W6RS89_9ACTN|nr:hypothetical protein [Actinoallomurus iriomotensis]GLY79172.1 hypothetical protein Airi01_074390 [Actinoallomurus iriomotensis]